MPDEFGRLLPWEEVPPEPKPRVESRYIRDLRRSGTEQLKRGMWKDLGVDYQPPGRGLFDDSQTLGDVRRQQAGGAPTIGGLQDQEMQMENRLFGPQPQQQIPSPQPKPIYLIPTDENPYDVQLHAVDFDPFAKV